MNHKSASWTHRWNQLVTDFPNGRIVDDTQTDVIGSCAELSNTGDDGRGGMAKQPEGLLAPRPQQDRITGLDNAPCDRCTLAAQANETADETHAVIRHPA